MIKKYSFSTLFYVLSATGPLYAAQAYLDMKKSARKAPESLDVLAARDARLQSLRSTTVTMPKKHAEEEYFKSEDDSTNNDGYEIKRQKRCNSAICADCDNGDTPKNTTYLFHFIRYHSRSKCDIICPKKNCKKTFKTSESLRQHLNRKCAKDIFDTKKRMQFMSYCSDCEVTAREKEELSIHEEHSLSLVFRTNKGLKEEKIKSSFFGWLKSNKKHA